MGLMEGTVVLFYWANKLDFQNTFFWPLVRSASSLLISCPSLCIYNLMSPHLTSPPLSIHVCLHLLLFLFFNNLLLCLPLFKDSAGCGIFSFYTVEGPSSWWGISSCCPRLLEYIYLMPLILYKDRNNTNVSPCLCHLSSPPSFLPD